MYQYLAYTIRTRVDRSLYKHLWITPQRKHGWCENIVWTNTGILSITPKTQTIFMRYDSRFKSFHSKIMHFKMSPAKWQPFFSRLINVVMVYTTIDLNGTLAEWVNGNSTFSTLRSKQNDRHFADDILKGIFLNGNFRVWIKISLKFVATGPLDNM